MRGRAEEGMIYNYESRNYKLCNKFIPKDDEGITVLEYIIVQTKIESSSNRFLGRPHSSVRPPVTTHSGMTSGHQMALFKSAIPWQG
jgi:hypothetical protein